MEGLIAQAAQQGGANLQVWFALVAAIFGGAGLKLIETLLSRGKVKSDAAAAIREELRVEVTNLRAEMKAVEADLDKWKDRYYTLLQQFIKATGIKPESVPGFLDIGKDDE